MPALTGFRSKESALDPFFLEAIIGLRQMEVP